MCSDLLTRMSDQSNYQHTWSGKVKFKHNSMVALFESLNGDNGTLKSLRISYSDDVEFYTANKNQLPILTGAASSLPEKHDYASSHPPTLPSSQCEDGSGVAEGCVGRSPYRP